MPDLLSKFLTGVLRLFFRLLYHEFAWSYDWVAWVVSIGRWKDWILSTLPYLTGPEVLELGHGPGHLQAALQRNGVHAFGLDESTQMGLQASQRLRQQGLSVCLVNGYAQSLPFPAQSFSQVVATFPSEYIFDEDVAAEIYRVLMPGGVAVILPSAIITGTSLFDRLAALLFRLTAQAPSQLDKTFISQLTAPFYQQGLKVETITPSIRSSQLLVLLARKSR